ncbi:hypothetical protein BP6252_12378 [Coleophoma cylindrospora]|uniref:NmrA-like domain-containing protein n=1 Tax=Coleophoma cylindrospora TaxID=1849047 RepID=A0A3D8QGR4_9HELO|nr:hypothetical protein BP6252_12378 [Coleophoma cylindrospora]
MSASNTIKNIAIVGATGKLGSLIFENLIANPNFNVTAITRRANDRLNASARTNSNVKIAAGSYDSEEFLVPALRNQDALVLALGFEAQNTAQMSIIGAAAKAGIEWVMPTEFGADNANERVRDSVMINSSKTHVRQRIEDLGMKWIGIATNPWFDYSLKGGFFSIDVSRHTATLFDRGTTKFNTTTMSTVGLAVARLFALPITSENGASLSQYTNKFCYIASFLVSQREILDSVQRVSGTTDNDWEIAEKSVDSYLAEGNEMIKNGDFMGAVNSLYGTNYIEGAGGNYQDAKGLSNDVLGLPKEDLDEVVKVVLNELRSRE